MGEYLGELSRQAGMISNLSDAKCMSMHAQWAVACDSMAIIPG